MSQDKIIKEGEVIFRNGEIVEIKGFEVKCDGENLEKYVKRNYRFSPDCEGCSEKDKEIAELKQKLKDEACRMSHPTIKFKEDK